MLPMCKVVSIKTLWFTHLRRQSLSFITITFDIDMLDWPDKINVFAIICDTLSIFLINKIYRIGIPGLLYH